MKAGVSCVQVVFLCYLIAAIFCQSQDSSFGSENGRQCPPLGFDSLQDFTLDDFAKYIAAPWYPQQLGPSPYLSAEYFFCLCIQYLPLNPADLSQGVQVLNYDNKNKVNGQPFTGSSNEAIAIFPDSSDASKLRIGFKNVTENNYADYWIVAVQPSNDETIGYDWAIISNGPPKTATESGCKTGLYFFTREKVASEDTLCAMRQKAMNLGFDVSLLKKVELKGCLYQGLILLN